jgi:hypothetical protein
MKFSQIMDAEWPQKWSKVKRSLTAVGRHKKQKRKKEEEKAAREAAAVTALEQQAEDASVSEQQAGNA